MQILSIHDGHNSSVCLLKDGKLVYFLNEERLSRKKNQGGFPFLSVQKILVEFNLKVTDINHFVFPTVSFQLTSPQVTNKNPLRVIASSGIFPGSLLRTKLVGSIYRTYGKFHRSKALSPALKQFGIPADKVSFHEHHLCHAATAYFYAPFEEGIAYTLDGAGDGLSGTVSTFKNGKFNRLHEIAAIDTLGGFFSRLTEFLGMKPLEHEYKLMGMAPYVDPKHAEEIIEIFRGYIGLTADGLSFQNKKGLWGAALVKSLHRDLYKKRFDNISAAGQLILEELILQWVKNWAKKTGAKNAIFSGGVFMNIKINKLINESGIFEKLTFTPSCGDESNVIGAALLKAIETGSALDRNDLEGRSIYLGNRITNDEILAELKNYSSKVRYEFVDDIEKRTAQLLAEFKIIGRMRGRMEWGARSLGNRAILANPQKQQIIRNINKAIKMRDFWMPFAGSILLEDCDKYLIGRNRETAEYMILGFDTTEKAHEDLIAALHPFDLTSRPQVVRKERNPDYHRLISEFKKITSIGGILNTSFNIHGEPIVCSPKDAIETLLNSGLDYVALENYLVSRK